MSQLQADVVIYGGTPGGVIAAVAAGRLGASVVLLEQQRHVGGMSTSGINTAESEHMLPESFSGLMLEFYRRIGAAYGKYVPIFHWEPHIAERVFGEMLDEAGVTVRFGQRLARVEQAGTRIRSLAMADGTTVAGRVFIDATYEGDLMAAAGVPYALGRESRTQYDEPLAGVRFVERPDDAAAYGDARTADTPIDVSPYDERGALLPGFVAPEGIVPGAADRKTMNYHYRVTVSSGEGRVPISAPPGYTPERFRMLTRYLARHPATTLRDLIDIYPFPSGRYDVQADGRTRALPGTKWELNNRQNAVISLGHFGGQFDYPEAGWPRRDDITQDHRAYNQGLLYFLGNDATVPRNIRDEMQQFGLAADEYPDNGHWPYTLYIREARRMIGAYVLTQHDVQHRRAKPDTIAIGSHWIDSHHVQRVAISDTQFRNEGRIWVVVDKPFGIPYRSITPTVDSCDNLLVPVCASASHVAFCTIRLESTWMALGHAAGTAAVLAAERDAAIQAIDVARLRRQLQHAGALLAL